MNKYIYHSLTLLAALLVATSAWGDALPKTGALESKTYTLTADQTQTGNLSIPSGVTAIVDLNGFTLDRKGSKAADFVFVVGGTLYIQDNSTSGTGKIKGGKGDRGGCAYITGTVHFEGGEVTECTSYDGDYGTEPEENPDKAIAGNQNWVTQGCGGAFYINSGATLNMSGNAKISNCATEKLDGTKNGRGGAVWVAGTFNMSGGTITGCKANYGGGVYVFDGSKNTFYIAGGDTRSGVFNMTGGTIENCRTFKYGGGVYTHSKVNIEGDAKISANRQLNWSDLTLIDGKYPKVQGGDCYGGGIYAEGEKAIVTMSGGEISNNLASSGGAVMIWGGATMNMTGGTMDGNYAMGSGGLGNGGAVYVQTSTFNFSGGTLSNNVANRYGGAVNTNQGGTLNMSGNCVITGNRASHGGGVSQEAGECSLTLGHSGIEIINNEAHGHQVNSDGTLSEQKGNGGGIFIEKGTVTMTGGKISGNSATGHGGGASLYVNRIHGATTTATITGGEISNNTAEYGGGIDMYAQHAQLDNGQKSNLVVNFEAGTLKENTASANGAGIYVSFNETYSTAKMTIGTSSTTPFVTENIATGNGGGFGMTNQGVIEVKSISASGNKAANGGAIWLGTGTFSITNGTLSDNTASQNGGGIYVGSGTFTVNGTTNLKGNKATAQNGGGIYLGGGTFTVSDAGSLNFGGSLESEGNSAGAKGGGVYCGAPFTVNGTSSFQYNSAADGGGVYVNTGYSASFAKEARFINNSATGNGGALYVTGTGSGITLNAACTISKNRADVSGGAFYVEDGSIVLNGTATISENTALHTGGAAHVFNGSISTAEGNLRTIISNNIVTGDSSGDNNSGGAFYIKGADANNKGYLRLRGETEIIGNSTYHNGGAIALDKGDVLITGAKTTMSDNRALNGGAVFVYMGDFKVQNANADIVLERNFARGNGGAIDVAYGNFVSSGKISFMENSSKGSGGAVYVLDGHITVNNPTMTGNSATSEKDEATNNGGAVCVLTEESTTSGFKATGAVTLNSNTAKDNGGAVYVSGGNIEIAGQSSVLTLSGNNAENGGAFYVNNGNINAGQISSAAITNNYSTAEGGAFYLNGGNITLCDSELSGNGKVGDEVKTVKGGAMALHNGLFTFGNNSEIKDNAASGYGGGLYVENAASTSITCQGGSYLNNKAGLGGGIYASGPIKLTFAANVRDNKARDGGGLYLDNGVELSFGNGLIVGNSAEKTGGGIYLSKGKLTFTATEDLGIYNNAASIEAADIYSSGSGTTIDLPDVSGMNLIGFEVPGSDLYWVMDFAERRYETALRNNEDIETMILPFGGNKTLVLTNEQCLDLGYDLVFVTLVPVGLDPADNASLTISYPHKTTGVATEYRKVVITGTKSQKVGLPSNQWQFCATPWSFTYDNDEVYNPVHSNTTDANQNLLKDYIYIKRNHNQTITITFSQTEAKKKLSTYDAIKVNIMRPGGSM